MDGAAIVVQQSTLPPCIYRDGRWARTAGTLPLSASSPVREVRNGATHLVLAKYYIIHTTRMLQGRGVEGAQVESDSVHVCRPAVHHIEVVSGRPEGVEVAGLRAWW